MRKILKIASAILLGVILIMNTGCARKGSRAWIENQISDIERVYPTENAEDLFEKFPNGFKVSQTRVFEENGERFKVNLVMKGDKNIKKIVGNVKKSKIKTEPRTEIVEKESEVEYKKGENLVLAKPELTEELLPRNYFLFQKLKLNKDIFKQLELEKNLYTHATGRYTILYKITNNVINNYFNLNNKQITLGVNGEYNEKDKTYFHSILVSDKNRELYEKIVEEGENNEGDSE